MYTWLMNMFGISGLTNPNSTVVYTCCALAVVMFTIVTVLICTVIVSVFGRKK